MAAATQWEKSRIVITLPRQGLAVTAAQSGDLAEPEEVLAADIVR